MSLSPIATPTVSHYQLTAVPDEQAVKVTSQYSLAVMPMGSSVTTDTTNMLYRNKPHQLASFTKHDWVAAPANMLMIPLLTALNNTHYFKSILVEPITANPDYILSSKLLTLYQDFTVNPSQIVMMVEVNLNTGNGQAIASQQFSAAVPTTDNTPKAGVVAANEASEQIIADIVEFAISHTSS
jgi:ABC-type uncharacterized transport system auxiliary subunit